MATNNSINIGLNGITGAGNFVGSNSPTLITPAIGTPSTLVLTNATGDQIGTTTNDNSSSGHVGEYISSSVLIGSAVSLSSGSASNVTSISLTAGDWDVSGVVVFNPSGLATSTIQRCGINTTSATMPTLGSENNVSGLNIDFAAGQGGYFNVGQTRLSLSSTTTVYLIAISNFLIGTMSAYGFIGARRVR